MQQLMRAHPLATLVIFSGGKLNANHIPLHLTPAPAPFGTLRGHIGRANSLWEDIDANIEALAIFHGPESYISPSWYATKQETNKVVPTWNYAVVHAYGFLRVVDDAVWLRAQLEALTSQQESTFPEPWAVADAPASFTEQLLTGIIGIEMVIARLLGKWKASQNQPPQNRATVMAGLIASGSSTATAMGHLVEAAAKKDDR